MDSISMSTANTSKVRSSKEAKVCDVCGDVAKSFHFGAISCDSCKAFFRRTVQAANHENFKCPFDVSLLKKIKRAKIIFLLEAFFKVGYI